MKHFKRFVWVLMGLLILSCDSSSDNFTIDDGHEYFPLTKGFYQIYDVNEVRYVLSEPETLQYELKVAVIDSFKNGADDYTYVLQRSKRVGNNPYTALETWSARISKSEAVMVEGNVPYVVLKFPIQKNLEWNGNVYNNVENPITGDKIDMFKITDTTASFDLGSSRIDQCATVVQEDNQEFIVYFDQRIDQFAPGAGLVSRTISQLNYCKDPDCLGQQIVEEGIIYTQTLREYGVE